jgi:protein phosphatase
MGGHQAGDVASGEVIRVFNELFSSAAYQEQVGYSPEREDYYVVVLKEVLEQINDRLYNMQGGRPDLEGMGTTGSVALFVNQRLYTGHVGDSRIYRLRGGELSRLTTDHSWVAEQVAAGALTPQEAAVHPKRNLLTQCLGHSPVLRVERTVHQVQLGDVLLLCSDGLTGVVQDAEIVQVLMSSPDPQQACAALIDLANQRGGPDNITVVIAQAVEGVGDEVSMGRAYGPHAGESLSQQADTVKLQRPRQKMPRQAAQPPVRRARRGASLGRSFLVAVLGVVVALACGYLGVRALDFFAERGLQFLLLFVATLIGVVAGLALSALLAGDGQRPSTGESVQRERPDSY